MLIYWRVSCLFVNLEGNNVFTILFRAWNATHVYQNPSVRKTKFHQVLAFTKFLPGFANSPGFQEALETTRCSPSFWKFTKSIARFWKFTRFWKCTRFSPSFGNSPGYHQVLEFPQIQPNFTIKRINFTKQKRKTASFGEFWRCKTLLCFFLVKPWWLHQVFTKFCQFTRFSPGFQIFTKPGRSIRRFQNRIKFSLQWW